VRCASWRASAAFSAAAQSASSVAFWIRHRSEIPTSDTRCRTRRARLRFSRTRRRRPASRSRSRRRLERSRFIRPKRSSSRRRGCRDRAKLLADREARGGRFPPRPPQLCHRARCCRCCRCSVCRCSFRTSDEIHDRSGRPIRRRCRPICRSLERRPTLGHQLSLEPGRNRGHQTFPACRRRHLRRSRRHSRRRACRLRIR